MDRALIPTQIITYICICRLQSKAMTRRAILDIYIVCKNKRQKNQYFIPVQKWEICLIFDHELYMKLSTIQGIELKQFLRVSFYQHVFFHPNLKLFFTYPAIYLDSQNRIPVACHLYNIRNRFSNEQNKEFIAFVEKYDTQSPCITGTSLTQTSLSQVF